MARSYVLYSGDASEDTFAIPFGYLDRDHVVVSVGGVEQTVETDYTFQSASVIEFVTAPGVGVSNVNVARNTPTNTAVVDFEDGTSLLEEELDNAALQALYATEEMLDALDDEITIRSAAINTVNTAMNTINTAYQAADVVLTDDLAAEAATRAAADIVLQDNIDAAVIAAGNVPTPADPADDDKVLTAAGGAYDWVAPASASGLPEAADPGDDGKILQAQSGVAAWTTKAVTAAQISDSTVPGRSVIVAASNAAILSQIGAEAAGISVLKALADAKGDLLVATAADTVVRFAVGASDDMLLAVNAAETPGLKWVTPTTPTTQTFLSGTAATYTRPAGVKYIELFLVGGGGGGGGGNITSDAGAGGNTTFSGGTLVAGGGAAGRLNSRSGAGTAASGGNIANINGAEGMTPGGAGASNQSGGPGGSSVLGGAGANEQGGATDGGAAVANTGSGGAGGSISTVNNPGGGGGAGSHVRHRIASPDATYTYTVGAGGTAGTAGTSAGAGGAGGSGILIVNEYYI